MGWFFIPRLVAAAMMIVMLVLMTRLLGAAQFARYNIAITIGALAYALIFGWLSSSMLRFHKAPDFEGHATAVVLGITLRVMLGFLVLTLLYGLLIPAIPDKFVLLAAVYFLAHSLHEMGLSGLRVLHAGPKFALAVIMRPVGAIILMIIALCLFETKYEGMLISVTIAAATIGAFSFWTTIRKVGLLKPRFDFAKKFFIFGAPLAFVSGASMIMSLVAQFTIASVADFTAVGVYAAAHILAMRTINMPMVMLGRSMAATVYQSFEEDGESSATRQLLQYSSFLLLISLPIVTVLVFANQTVATLLFGNALKQGVAPHLPILAIAAFLSGLQGAFFSYAFTIQRRTGIQATIIIATTALHAVLSYILAILFGPIGVSYAMLAASSVGLTAFIIYGRRLHQVSVPREHIIKLAPALFALSLCAMAADRIRTMPLSIALIGMGVALFLVILYIQKFWAMRRIVEKLYRQFGGTNIVEHPEAK